MRKHIFQGSKFEDEIGYARALVDGDWIFVSGTTGYDYETGAIAPDVVGQTKQTLANIAWALGQAGATLDDVVRVTYILPDPEEFEATWPLLRAAFATARPAATMISSRVINDEIKIEIEVTARKAQG